MAESLKQQIDRLQELYESELDPRGRAFVPLADAHRRLGDLGKALALIEEGLGTHPDFASAHLVLGWVHRSRQEPDDAMRSFERVLALDAENTVARAAIAELIDDQRAQAYRDQVAARESGERPVVPIASLAPGAPMETVAAPELVPEDGRPVVPIASLAPGAPAGTSAPADAAPESAPAEDRPVVPIASLAPGAPAGTSAPADAAPESAPAEDRPVVPIASLAPGAPAGTSAPADAAPESAPAEDRPVVPIASLAPVEQDESSAAPDAAPESVRDGDDRPVVPIPSLVPEGDEEASDGDGQIDGEIYTQTLAELYVAQGATGRAIEVYGKLIADDPDNEALHRRLTELESLESGADGAPAELNVRAGLGALVADLDERQTVSIESLAPDGIG